VNEIPDATYTGPGTEPQVISIPYALTGQYTITLIGTATGNYTLTIDQTTEAETMTQVFNGTISLGEQRYYTAILSEPESMTTISWECFFEDSRRGTMLKISTDDKYFQFVGPGKNFGIKHDFKMVVWRNVILLCFQDSEMRIVATANSKIGFCSATAWDKQTGKKYLLIDIPNWHSYGRFTE
jgi:hypothetical protein